VSPPDGSKFDTDVRLDVRLALLEDHLRHVEEEMNTIKRAHDELVAKTNKAAGGVIVLMALGTIAAWVVTSTSEIVKWFK